MRRRVSTALLLLLPLVAVLVGTATASSAATPAAQSAKATAQPRALALPAPYTGTFTVDQFTTTGGRLAAVGTVAVTNTATNQHATETVTVPVGTANSNAAAATSNAAKTLATPQALSCSVLNLVLGPLHLNLLGLNIDLNQVNLVITAIPGNLLGDLLCGLGGLLGNLNLSTLLANLLNGLLGLL